MQINLLKQKYLKMEKKSEVKSMYDSSLHNKMNSYGFSYNDHA